MPKIFCPNCGELRSEDISVYNAALRKQNIAVSPVYPTCKRCQALVSVEKSYRGGAVIVLNGTCGSGKSTVAEALTAQYGYFAIDGDCATQALKQKLDPQDPSFRAKVEFNSAEMLDEIAFEIDCLRLLGDKIVLAHIVLPQDIDRFIHIFRARGLAYSFCLLQPSYEVAVARCQTRTCHQTITPESYVRYYDEKLRNAPGFTMIDNSALSLDETVQAVLLAPKEE